MHEKGVEIVMMAIDKMLIVIDDIHAIASQSGMAKVLNSLDRMRKLIHLSGYVDMDEWGYVL